MAMLALYWSIMIACYLIASKLRRHADKFHFLDALTNLFIYFLIFLMGLRMGADEEVTSSLGSIGVQALFVTLLTAVGSMLGATAARKIVHLNRHSLPAGTEEEGAEEHGGGVNTTGIKSSVIICLMVICGMLLGYFVLPQLISPERFEEISGNLLVIGLCIMLGSVGFSMGLDGSARRWVSSSCRSSPARSAISRPSRCPAQRRPTCACRLWKSTAIPRPWPTRSARAC